MNVANSLVGERSIEIKVIGIRPGEKVHETLVSDEEAHRTIQRGDYYVILPMLPEMGGDAAGDGSLLNEYSSGDNLMTLEETKMLLKSRRLMLDDMTDPRAEILR